MTESIRIRSACEQDIEQLAVLLAELFRIETDFSICWEKQMRGLRLMLQQPDSRIVFVAVHKRSIVGMCSGQTLISTAAGGISVRIEDVIVAAQYRGQGIGRKLMRKISLWAKNQGAVRLELLVDGRNNAAGAFYRRQGWATTQMISWHKQPDKLRRW